MEVQWIQSLHAGDLDGARRGAAGDSERLALVDELSSLQGVGTLVAARTKWSSPQLAAQAAVARAHAHLMTLGAAPAPTHVPDGAWGDCARGVTAFVAGGVPDAGELSSEPDPALRVEQMCVRALAALATDDLDGATRLARRASRAAYAEGLRGLEYLAYWLLGRIRRVTQNLHAATRIFGAMARSAPRAWWPLVDWELVLAGGGRTAAQRALCEPAASWVEAVSHARDGRRDASALCLARLRDHPLPARFATERDHLLDGMSGVSELGGHARVAGALFESAERIGLTPATWRLAPDEAPALRWCLGASDEPRLLFDEGERIQTLAASLAEAGPRGMPHEEIFRSVYGFDYEAALHEGLFRVLLHRTRACLASAADVRREGANVVLVPHAVVILPEPRSAPPFGDRLLRAIAASPGVTSKELASMVGDNVRTVQRALRLLLDCGTCRSERQGRKTVYTVEDTTFSEPTHFGRGRGGA